MTTQAYDALYAALNVGLALGLAVSAAFGLLFAFTGQVAGERRRGAGTAWIAVGTAVALAGGLFADAALKSAPLFQQVRFGFYYAGFALVLLGTVLVASGPAARPSWRTPSKLLALAYGGSVLIAGVFVTVPATFVLNRYHEQVQLVGYWVPLLVATAGGTATLLLSSRRTRAEAPPWRVRLVAAFEALLFVGLLRESGIIPDLGDPVENLLIAFLPFVGGGLLLAASSVGRPHQRPRESPPPTRARAR